MGVARLIVQYSTASQLQSIGRSSQKGILIIMSTLIWALVLGTPLLLYLLYRSLRSQFWVLFPGDPNSTSNPFKSYARDRRDLPMILDQKERDKVLKQSFSPDKVPPQLDAIVVGSGIGGLTAAALLAKTGKKVLVLEQHDQAGGCCHTFIDKGFEFDVGIHYVGEMAEGTVCRVLVDQLSGSGIKWRDCDEVYDTVILGMGGAPSERKQYPIPAGRGKLMESLINTFPKEKNAINKFFGILKSLRRSTMTMALLKMLPVWAARLLISMGLLGWVNPELRYYQCSLTEVLDQLFRDEELKAVLAYSFGDYGTLPKDASFGMQAILTNHFMYGGYYPVGGASEIAYNIIPTIEGAGGRVLVRAKVTKIILDDMMSKAVGVAVQQGHNEYTLKAPLVISDAGLYNTVERLLPSQAVSQYNLGQVMKRVRHGVGLMSVFVGLDGTPKELGLKASHVWAFRGTDLNQITEEFTRTRQEDITSAAVPLMFLSFPSTKDPTYSQRFPGKSTVAIVTLAPYEWFKEWEQERVQHRGDDYEGLKNALGDKLWSQVLELFPQLDGHKVYMDVGTPLSNIHYLGTPQGEVYGVDHNTSRFSLEAMSDLRPDIGIPGLHLTGQDVFICGLIGAMFGGVLCASSVLKRNLMGDLMRLVKEAKREAVTKKD